MKSSWKQVIFCTFCLIFLFGCQTPYSKSDQQKDKIQILSAKGDQLSPMQRAVLIQNTFSSKEEMEEAVEKMIETNLQAQENFEPKQASQAGPKVITPKFYRGRQFLNPPQGK